MPKKDKKLAEEALKAFRAASSQLVYKIGAKSKALNKIRLETDLPELHLQTAYMQEGSKQMDGFIKTIMVNYMNVLSTRDIPLIDIALLGILVFAHAVNHGLQQGWKLPPEFVDEQTAMFRAGLEDVLANHEKQKEATDTLRDAPRIEVVKA